MSGRKKIPKYNFFLVIPSLIPFLGQALEENVTPLMCISLT
jgi:hypothetical protein